MFHEIKGIISIKFYRRKREIEELWKKYEELFAKILYIKKLVPMMNAIGILQRPVFFFN